MNRHPHNLTQDQILASLVGSHAQVSAGGQSYSWVILNGGGGNFAVVPEPSMLALLGAAGTA